MEALFTSTLGLQLQYVGDYVRAVGWAQRYAALNREPMMAPVLATLRCVVRKPFDGHVEAVNSHPNYVQRERHFGRDCGSRARAR